MATGANIKQGNSRSSSTIFLCLQGIRSSCPCRGSTLLQTSATTTYHSSISANFETKWGKKESYLQQAAFFFLNKTLLSEEGRQGRAGTEQQWWLEDSEWGWMSQTQFPSGQSCLNVGLKWVREQQLLHQLCLTENFPATLLLMEEPSQPLQVTQHLEICQAEGENGAVRAVQGWEWCQPCPPASSQARWSLAEPSWLSEQHILPFTLQAMNGNPSPQITLLISTERDQECTWLSVLPVQI